MQTEGMTVQRMIGIAVRNIGLEELKAIYQWDGTSATDVEYLNQTLHRLLRDGRKGTWDTWEDLGLLGYEPDLPGPNRLTGFGAGLIPSFIKAKCTLCLSTMRFDTLYLGAACRVYKARHGRYPSDPKELIPEILPLWPRDPWSRRPYVLETSGDRLIIRTVQPPSEKDIPGVRLEYPETQETKTTERMEQPSRNRTRL